MKQASQPKQQRTVFTEEEILAKASRMMMNKGTQTMEVKMRNLTINSRSGSRDSQEQESDIHQTNASRLLHIMKNKRDLD